MTEKTAYPIPAVGAVVFHENKVLLVKRGKAPAAGYWAIPGGKMRLGEGYGEAAEREIFEETGIRIRAGKVVWVMDLLEKDGQDRIIWHYLIVDVLGHYLEGQPRAGDDAKEAAWISEEELGSLCVSPDTLKMLAETFGFGENTHQTFSHQ
ncbi:NUDIX hydrolase [Desulfobotulus sp. H1]|uniref:NUDIX hydrolase n=1 Tax=Desulfobotulus pelophilus TaxID=2823377 RepID=A0ABT3NAJ6_9BACT|nr:NUDIX hydrolase [Desulfobotulus pelophilus]MCW7754498.1 NUDIX hydrolase [Desulfobotulus pelophilus]